MAFAIFIFFTPRFAIFAKPLRPNPYPLHIFQKTHWRWIVSAGLITGIVLVFLLLGYLVYALINAEAF